MSKPLNHPDYRIPGTNLVSFSKWSRENEPKAPHRIPLGQVVDVTLGDDGEPDILHSEAHNGRPVYLGIKGEARLIVVEHHFDCDGTALYMLAAKPVAPPVAGRIAHPFYDSFVRFCQHGYTEESLRPVAGVVLPVTSYEQLMREMTARLSD